MHSKFSESKILRVKNELVAKKIISVKQRFRADGSQTSNLYKIESEFIGVFVTGKNMSNMDTSPFTDEEADTFTHEGGTPSREKGLEVLASRRVNNKEVLEGCEFKNSLLDLEVKNPFTRKKLDDLKTQKEKESKENSAKEKKEKEPREPNEIYQAYECFCLFHESVSAAKYPRTLNDNLIINPIDSRNIKLLLTWIKSISLDNPIDNLNAFLKGVWLLNDKYINSNFNIGLLYRQSSSLYAKVQTINPVVSKQRKEEQLNAEAAEFLKKRYGIVN